MLLSIERDLTRDLGALGQREGVISICDIVVQRLADEEVEQQSVLVRKAACTGFGASFAEVFDASAEGFVVAFGASEVAGLAGAVATAAGAFALVAEAEEVSVFAVEEGVDEAGAVC